MGLIETLRDGLREGAAEALGFSEPLAEGEWAMTALQEAGYDARMLARKVEDLNWDKLNESPSAYFTPSRENRKEQVARSYNFYFNDPIIRRTVDLRTFYVFGNGVPVPSYRTEHEDASEEEREAQDLIDNFFGDEFNQETLTSVKAQHEKSLELQLQGNVYLLGLLDIDTPREKGERSPLRLSDIPEPEIVEIITHPGNRKVPVFYKRVFMPTSFNFATGAWTSDATGVTRYYRHWKHEAPTEWEGKPWGPPEELIGKGSIYHISVNHTSDMKWGLSELNSVLKFAAGLNTYQTARMSMVMALSQLAMQAKTHGGPRSVSQVAGAMSDISRLATQIEGSAGMERIPINQGRTKVALSSKGVQLEPMVQDTGAAGAQQDTEMFKGQIAAGTGWPVHHYGGSGSAGLATACHDEATEALTEEGWLSLDELIEREKAGALPKLAGYDVEKEELVYQRPDSELKLYDYDGEMIAMKSRGHDLLVTPNHRMLVRRGDWLKIAKAPSFRLAGDLTKGARVYARVGAAVAARPRVDTFVLPARPIRAPSGLESRATPAIRERNKHIRERVSQGDTHAAVAAAEDCSQTLVCNIVNRARKPFKMRPLKRIPMDKWLKWLGLYIAEGAKTAEVYQSVANHDFAEVQAVCKAIDPRGTEHIGHDGGYAARWYWSPRNPTQFADWLDEHAGKGCADKRVPSFVFDLPAEQQRILLDGLLLGDGHLADGFRQGGGSAMFWTTSKRLADDVQRIAVNCGLRAMTRCEDRNRADRKVRPCYVVSLMLGVSAHGRARSDWSVLPPPKRVPYRGRVWCFALPSSTMVTRRNGVVAISGNTAMDAGPQKMTEADQTRWEGVFVDVIGRWMLTEMGFESERVEVNMPPILTKDFGTLVQSLAAAMKAVDPKVSSRELVRWFFGELLDAMGHANTQELLDKFFPAGWVSPAAQEENLMKALYAGGEAPPTGATQVPELPPSEIAGLPPSLGFPEPKGYGLGTQASDGNASHRGPQDYAGGAPSAGAVKRDRAARRRELALQAAEIRDAASPELAELIESVFAEALPEILDGEALIADGD